MKEIEELAVIAITYTTRCNLSCAHCGRGRVVPPREEKGASFFVEVLKEGLTVGTNQVNITGGEIFCRRDCFDLIQGAVELGYFVSIESNGTLIDQKSTNCLATYGDAIRVSVSVDGLTAKTHDAIRGKGNFDITMATILGLQKANVPTRIITVLHRQNLEQIPQIARHFVDELGLGFRLLPNIMEYGKGVYACDALGVEFDQAMTLLDGFYFDFLRKHASGNVNLEINMALAPLDIDQFCRCAWGEAMIGIGPTGIVALCHVSYQDDRFIFGDLGKTSLTEIWTMSSKLDAFRNLNVNELKGVCGNCLAREVCRGGCRFHAITKYGDFFAPDPYCQTAYNLGRFPDYTMEEENRDCKFE